MNKTLVTIFDNEDAAFNGLNTLKTLHRNGDITLYDTAVVAKDDSGGTRVLKTPDDVPTGTFLGMFLGALIGALGGPIGMAVGTTTGTLIGATSDVVEDSVDFTFLQEVREALAPGKVAVLADVEETWVTPVDLTISEQGGIVLRRLRHEIVEDQLAREHAEFEEELRQLKKDLATATGDAKAGLEARIASVQRSLAETRSMASARAAKLAAEWTAKREAMERQLKDADMRERVRIKHQMEKAKQDFETRHGKLRQAQQLVAEAFRP